MNVRELMEMLSKADPEDAVMVSPDESFTNAIMATEVEFLENNPGIVIR